jgi:hypothetical protein
MSELESSSTARRMTREIQPRQPHREIAEILAAAIVRMREKNCQDFSDTNSEVCLGFTGTQRVNTNPSYTEGVQE